MVADCRTIEVLSLPLSALRALALALRIRPNVTPRLSPSQMHNAPRLAVPRERWGYGGEPRGRVLPSRPFAEWLLGAERKRSKRTYIKKSGWSRGAARRLGAFAARPSPPSEKRRSERLTEYGWKPHRVLLHQKNLSRASICWYMCENRGVRIHRIRDFKHYLLNSIPPTSQGHLHDPDHGGRPAREAPSGRAVVQEVGQGGPLVRWGKKN